MEQVERSLVGSVLEEQAVPQRALFSFLLGTDPQGAGAQVEQVAVDVDLSDLAAGEAHRGQALADDVAIDQDHIEQPHGEFIEACFSQHDRAVAEQIRADR